MYLRGELINPIRWVLPLAFFLMGIMIFISAMLNIREHEPWAYLLSVVGFVVLFFELKRRKKVKKKIDVLTGALI